MIQSGVGQTHPVKPACRLGHAHAVTCAEHLQRLFKCVDKGVPLHEENLGVRMERRQLAIMRTKLKPMPTLGSDTDAQQFVENADLSTYDLSGFKPMRFEFEPKAAALNMRLPQNLLDALKLKAKSKGIPYTRYVRLLLESDVAN